MKNWASGKYEAAAKVDPALAAVVTSIVDLVVMLDLHTKLGVSPEQLLGALLHVAVIATLFRTIQTNYRRKPAPEPAAAPEPEPEPEEEPAPDTAEEESEPESE